MRHTQRNAGTVDYVSAREIVVKRLDGNKDRYKLSSAVSSVSPFGVTLPTRISPGRTSAPTRIIPRSSRFFKTSSPTFGICS